MHNIRALVWVFPVVIAVVLPVQSRIFGLKCRDVCIFVVLECLRIHRKGISRKAFIKQQRRDMLNEDGYIGRCRAKSRHMKSTCF